MSFIRMLIPLYAELHVLLCEIILYALDLTSVVLPRWCFVTVLAFSLR